MRWPSWHPSGRLFADLLDEVDQTELTAEPEQALTQCSMYSVDDFWNLKYNSRWVIQKTKQTRGDSAAPEVKINCIYPKKHAATQPRQNTDKWHADKK